MGSQMIKNTDRITGLFLELTWLLLVTNHTCSIVYYQFFTNISIRICKKVYSLSDTELINASSKLWSFIQYLCTLHQLLS